MTAKIFLCPFVFLLLTTLITAQENTGSTDARTQETLVDRIEALDQSPETNAAEVQSAVSDLESKQFAVSGPGVRVTSVEFNQLSKIWTFRLSSLDPEIPFRSTLGVTLTPLDTGELNKTFVDRQLVGTIRYSVVRVKTEGRYYLRVTGIDLTDKRRGLLESSRAFDQKIASFVPGHRDQVKPYFEVGKVSPDGGYIFHVDGEKYSEAALVDRGQMTWAGALKAASNYGEDDAGKWRLPTRKELDQIYSNLGKKGIGPFLQDFYWSSDEEDALHAWYQSFRTGEQFRDDKGDYALVCVVRVF